MSEQWACETYGCPCSFVSDSPGTCLHCGNPLERETHRLDLHPTQQPPDIDGLRQAMRDYLSSRFWIRVPDDDEQEMWMRPKDETKGWRYRIVATPLTSAVARQFIEEGDYR